MANFGALQILDNANGWGPCAIPEKFKDMPYQPFSKGDRLGKVGDWLGQVYQDRNRRYVAKYASQFAGSNQYSYFHGEDEDSFQLIDYAKTPKQTYQHRNRMKLVQQKLRRQMQQTRAQSGQMSVLNKGKLGDKNKQKNRWGNKPQWGRGRWDQRQAKSREASVQVKEDWKVIEEMDFSKLLKLKSIPGPVPTDLVTAGSLAYYDKSMDKINPKTERKLERTNRTFHTVTTTDDPIIRDLARKEGTVFATDSIIIALMCSTRSVYSWDIIVQKFGSKLFFDKRCSSDIDMLTVNETASETPYTDDKQSINSAHNLSLEATFLSQSFSQQCLKHGEEKKMEQDNPFVVDDSLVASVAYKYRKWDLGGGTILVARCEVDAVMATSSGDQVGLVKILNDWDPKLSGAEDWRPKLETQKTAVLATELKNNSYKVAKWTAQALLGDADFIKLGYISRVTPKDSSRHTILGVQQFKPKDFANNINLNFDNCWAIMKYIVERCKQLEDGKYLLLKDPNKPVIRLYKIPDETFESEDEDLEAGSDHEID